LLDEMYADASFHNEQGAWQMIFGVNTLPEYRRRGLAERVLRRVIGDAKAQGRRGCVLTCKEALVHYYARLGFVSEGVSASVHGGAVWYDMRLTFGKARKGGGRQTGFSGAKAIPPQNEQKGTPPFSGGVPFADRTYASFPKMQQQMMEEMSSMLF